ncbi:PREDICTED: cytosolic sulfotransferase 5 [Theobroma cacao]|uniref:Sulfotransferase n=1 Tax=Theobroma cacao TaxID=3641 RepID=A0AB32VL37_THECC|nr:PREDICTED: cytosolic sulfotransferase 5 [Theobroma cacao]
MPITESCPLPTDLPPVSLPKYVEQEGRQQQCRQLTSLSPTEKDCHTQASEAITMPAVLNLDPCPLPTDLPPVSLPKFLQEECLTQERRQLIASLPTEKGWVANHLHQYQGFWHTTRQLLAVLTCQNQFQAQDTDILLVTTPKSGTTWLKAIVFALMNRVQYPNPEVKHPLLAENPHVLVPFLELELYIDNRVADFTTFTSPRLFGTHLPLVSLPDSVKNSACKLVYLCRNPKDTFVSLWHFTNKLRTKDMGENSLEETFDKFCRGVCLYGPFWDHVLEYWKESLKKPERVLFLKYEEIKEQPKVQLVRLAQFLGCPFSAQEETNGVVDEILKLCSFDTLSNLEVNKTGKLVSGEEYKAFFRRGEVGDAKNHLTPQMMEKLDQITQDKLHDSGLIF